MKARPGLTLIEVVVTLVVASLAMTAGYAALTTIVDRRSEVIVRISRDMAASELRQMLAQWIAGAELTIEEDQVLFRGLDGNSRGIPDDVLELRTTAVTTATESGALVRLFVDRSDSTPQRGLTAEVRRPREVVSRFFELDRNVAALDIRYLSAHLGARMWSTSWVSASVLPMAAELTLAALQPDSLATLLRMPILVPVHTR